MSPVRGDDEMQTAESERDARDDPSRGAGLQRRDSAATNQIPANRISRNPTSAMITPV
jgi:hypothetical protein